MAEKKRESDSVKHVIENIDSTSKKVQTRCNYTCTLRGIELGLTQKQIAETYGFSLRTVKYHFSTLKAQGKITKKAYGVWSKVYIAEGAISQGETPPVTHQTPPLTPPLFSLHDLVFKVRLPLHFPAWKSRESLIAQAFGVLENKGSFQQINFKGYKVQFYDRWIVLYLSRAFYGHDYATQFKTAHSYAQELLRDVCIKLRLFSSLKRSFEVYYTDRQHFAHVNDPVARELRHNKQKVRVPLRKGYFVIDFSEHIDHAEEQNGRGQFIEQKWQPFIKDLEATGWTPGFQMEMNTTFLKNIGLIIVAVKQIKDRMGGFDD